MASRFAPVRQEQILAVNEAAVAENTKKATKFGLAVFKGTVTIFSREVIAQIDTKRFVCNCLITEKLLFQIAQIKQCKQ